MAAKPMILRELDDLPADAVKEVVRFIRYVKKCRKTRKLSSVKDKEVARKQFMAIKKWAGQNLGDGFSGREHDNILYGGVGTFVDTGAWFAVAVRKDPDHESAMRWLRRNRERLITTDYVLAETATLIRARDKTTRGHRLAVRVAASLLRQESALLEKVNEGDLAAALNVFRKYSDHLFSFVDCTSFVIMERLGITEAFAFDNHFDEYPRARRVPRRA